MDDVYLNSLHCFADPDSYQAQLAYLAEVLTCSDSGFINIVDPRVYAVKVRGGNADNPTYQQAINGADSAEYLKAMKLEVDTLVGQRTWEKHASDQRYERAKECPTREVILCFLFLFFRS